MAHQRETQSEFSASARCGSIAGDHVVAVADVGISATAQASSLSGPCGSVFSRSHPSLAPSFSCDHRNRPRQSVGPARVDGGTYVLVVFFCSERLTIVSVALGRALDSYHNLHTSTWPGVVCCGLEEVQVLTAKDIFNILGKGIQQRKTAETLMNKNSSRYVQISYSSYFVKIDDAFLQQMLSLS